MIKDLNVCLVHQQDFSHYLGLNFQPLFIQIIVTLVDWADN